MKEMRDHILRPFQLPPKTPWTIFQQILLAVAHSWQEVCHHGPN